MTHPIYYIGIDISSTSFTAVACTRPNEFLSKPEEFENSQTGFGECATWLASFGISPETSVVCMEATGVYGERLAYFLYEQQYQLAVEPPLKVKKAFYPHGHKNDRVDSQQIAEYAFRFYDRLTFWQPRKEVLEQVKTLLATREQFVNQRTACKNTLKSLKRKQVRVFAAEKALLDQIASFTQLVKQLEKETWALIKTDPHCKQTFDLLRSIPGVGKFLAGHMTVVFFSRSEDLFNHRKVAAYLGIAPYEHQSGTSVYKRPSSRHYGPPAIRKLLHLGARSICFHRPSFHAYYNRKLAEGKKPTLVLNNVSNKLVKIMCAVVRNQTPYTPEYRSAKPFSLTRS